MLLGVLLIFYFFITLFSLTALPVSDEAIYIRWAQIAWHEPVKYLFPMLDGKTPSCLAYHAIFKTHS